MNSEELAASWIAGEGPVSLTEITSPQGTLSSGQFTSERLTVERVYTREELKALFAVSDATINTGIFQPAGTSSIWLFITKEKAADRTPYSDRLDGDLLYWQGQTAGRKDQLIVAHVGRGLELLVFFRTREYAGAGFKYLGEYEYVSHSGSHPTLMSPVKYTADNFPSPRGLIVKFLH